MAGTVRQVSLALAAAFLAGTAAQAQNAITVDDARVLELQGNWVLNVSVRVPTPTTTAFSVDYTLVSGSAQAPSDFIAGSGTLSFAVLDDTKVVSIQINGDAGSEWNSTLMQDEVFHIQLSNPTAGATLAKDRGTVTLIDDDRLRPGVNFLTAVSTGGVTTGQNKLQWRIPGAQTAASDVKIAWKQGAGCTFPLSDTDTFTGGLITVGSAAAPGAVQSYTHTARPIGVPHCYSVFAVYGGQNTTEIANLKATPINTTGTIAWSYASGAASVVPPTVGADAIYTTDNRGVVHALQRGTTGGGVWPSSWNPVAVGDPTQARSAVVPWSGGSRVFLGTDGGGVHAIDGRFGTVIWSRSSTFGSSNLPTLGGVQAQPAVLLKAFGGNNDMVLVGTNNTTPSNSFFALDPATGATLGGSAYGNVNMGNVGGMAVVDYPGNRVFFVTTSASGTLFGLDLGLSGSPALTLPALPGGNPKPFPAGTMGSAIVRGNRLVFGDNAGTIHSIDLVAGGSYNVASGDGQVKGFLWPDRRDERLYYSGLSRVSCVRDTGTGFATGAPIWSTPVTSPSMVLQKPGSDYLYVGNGLGQLVQIDVNNPGSPTTLTLESGVQIGAPSLDGPNNLVIVGSATGIVYAVRVPF